MDLTSMVRNTISKEGLGEEGKYTSRYNTGLDMLDYRNGRIENGEEVLGTDGGRIMTIIGNSGTGKTALAMLIAKNIVNKYDEGQIIDLDFERAMTVARAKQITQWDDVTFKKKFILMNRKIYSESLYSLVKSIANIKSENFESLKVDTGSLDDDGKKIYELPPTVIIVDSWASVIPKDISEEEELSGQMSATSIARVNNSMIKRIVGPLEEGNITFIIINHITQKVEIGPVKTQASLNYLKQGESLPGKLHCQF